MMMQDLNENSGKFKTFPYFCLKTEVNNDYITNIKFVIIINIIEDIKYLFSSSTFQSNDEWNSSKWIYDSE